MAVVTVPTTARLLDEMENLNWWRRAIADGENVLGLVGGKTTYSTITLTLDTSAYASGDVLSATQTLANAVRVDGGTGIVQSVQVINKDDKTSPFDVLFLSQNVSIGAENSAVSLTTANAQAALQGAVGVRRTDYIDLINSRCATVEPLNKFVINPESDSKDVFIGCVSRGTPTHTANGIHLKIGILSD